MGTPIQRGDFVAYVPFGKILHESTEYGVVTSVKDDVVFCRFFHKNFNRGNNIPPSIWDAKVAISNLRTQSNSEAVSKDRVVVLPGFIKPRIVEEFLSEIEKQ